MKGVGQAIVVAVVAGGIFGVALGLLVRWFVLA